MKERSTKGKKDEVTFPASFVCLLMLLLFAAIVNWLFPLMFVVVIIFLLFTLLHQTVHGALLFFRAVRRRV